MCNTTVEGSPLQIPEPFAPSDMKRMNRNDTVHIGYGYKVKRESTVVDEHTNHYCFVLMLHQHELGWFYTFEEHDPEICFLIEATIVRFMLQELAGRMK